jgi:hypothetical protein
MSLAGVKMWDRVGLHTTRWRASGIGSALAILFTLAATSAMPSPALASSGSTAEPSSNPSGASSSYLQSLSCSSSSDCTAVGYQNDPTNRTCPTTPTSRQDRRWEARSDRSSNCSGGAMCCRRLHKRTATKEGETMRSMLKRPAALPAAIVATRDPTACSHVSIRTNSSIQTALRGQLVAASATLKRSPARSTREPAPPRFPAA